MPDVPKPSSMIRRVWLLVGCIAAGLMVGWVGESITSQAGWYLAVPLCMAIGWLFVANPTQCVAKPDLEPDSIKPE